MSDKEKTRYSKAELEEFREIIHKKLSQAKDELKYQTESLKENNENSSDGHNITDFGSDTLDREQTEMLMARSKKFIANLERALIRIENGTYGICKVTGKLIAKERLRVVPHTESSMAAKAKQYDPPRNKKSE